MGASQVGIAVPNFWFAILLVLVFAVDAATGSGRRLSRWERAGAALGALMLPAVALGLVAGGDPDPRHPLGADRGA